MTIQKDIPAKVNVAHTVERVTFNLSEKKAYVEVYSDNTSHQVITVDIIKLFTDYSSTATQKNTIKAFFRYVIAEALEIAENTITEEIFPET